MLWVLTTKFQTQEWASGKLGPAFYLSPDYAQSIGNYLQQCGRLNHKGLGTVDL
jgi:hypothetical protein